MEKHIKMVLLLNYKRILGNQLKNFTAKGKLMKVKTSFKLSESGKMKAKPKPKPIKEKRQSEVVVVDEKDTKTMKKPVAVKSKKAAGAGRRSNLRASSLLRRRISEEGCGLI